MLRLLTFSLIILLSACTKSSPQSEVRSPPFDAKKLFLFMYGEQMQLLALKYEISPVVAEKIAWEFFQEHDVGVKMLAAVAGGKVEAQKRDPFAYDDKIAEAVIALAAKYSQKQQAVAGFIADLRLFQRANREK